MTRLNNTGHDFVVELLPWYVNGTLSPAENASVEEHLATCSECRELLAEYRQLDSADAISDDTTDWQPSQAHFAGIMQGIDALESKAETIAVPAKQPSLLTKVSAWLKTIPGPVYWFMSFETLALAALVLLLVGHVPPPQQGEQLFQTLSNERPPVTVSLPRLSIVFAADITEREIRTLLQAQHGQLVQGPSMLGVYTVQLAFGGEQELQNAITNLRANPKVELAEVLPGADRQ